MGQSPRAAENCALVVSAPKRAAHAGASRIFMNNAPISGASESPASVSSGIRARRAFSCSAHNAALKLASMRLSSRRRADQPQELRLQIFFLDTQLREIDALLDQPPCDILWMRDRISACEAESAS